MCWCKALFGWLDHITQFRTLFGHLRSTCQPRLRHSQSLNHAMHIHLQSSAREQQTLDLEPFTSSNAQLCFGLLYVSVLSTTARYLKRLATLTSIMFPENYRAIFVCMSWGVPGHRYPLRDHYLFPVSACSLHSVSVSISPSPLFTVSFLPSSPSLKSHPKSVLCSLISCDLEISPNVDHRSYHDQTISAERHIQLSMCLHKIANMPSAAFFGLYTARLITLHSLNDANIKLLASILRHIPTSENWPVIREAIQDLPPHLRSSTFSHRRSTCLSQFVRNKGEHEKVRPGCLCHEHAGLNAGMVCDIWTCIRREFDKGVGHTFYPIIMHGGLRAEDEWKIRQIEPVLRMWHPEYTVSGCVPPGRAPIEASEKWAYQENGCPACLLSRIGSDKGTVYALLVGCVARYPGRYIGKRDRVRSRRVMFVRCWVEAFDGGKWRADEAWDLGEEIRRIGKELKEWERAWRGPGFYGRLTWPQIFTPAAFQSRSQGQTQTRSLPVSRDNTPSYPKLPSSSRSTSPSDIGIDISDPFDPNSNPATSTLNGSTAVSYSEIPSISSTRCSEIETDISEPYNSTNLYLDVPVNTYSQRPPGSSIYSRTELSIRHNTLQPHRQPFSSPSLISIPSSMPSFQGPSYQQTSSVPSSMPQFSGPRISMCSLKARVESAQTEWKVSRSVEWEEQGLVPGPLSLCSDLSVFTPIAGTSVSNEVELGRGSIRGGTGTDMYRQDGVFRNMGDEGVVPRYHVSPPNSPTGDSRNRNSEKGNLKSTEKGRLYDGSAFGDI
jgi:hypothetical protein